MNLFAQMWNNVLEHNYINNILTHLFILNKVIHSIYKKYRFGRELFHKIGHKLNTGKK